MSSTNSSDSESCDCSQCNYSFENNHNDYGKLLMNSRHIPMYATMAHPLIYYAEVHQPLNRKQTYDQPKKDNPFKKAFKWYTQERTMCNKNDVTPERSGFANWLDNKYVEYLRESGQQTKGPPTSHESRQPNNAIAETCPPCQGTTKKFGRFKSPWRKRRRPGNDSGDVPKTCPAGSCEFLLKPKEITRAASETWYHTPTSGGKSNSTTSSNMPCNTKCSGRSHSLSDVAREKSAPHHGDTVPHAVQECPNCQAPMKLYTTDCTCHQKEGRTKLPKPTCMCPQDQGPSKKQDVTNQAIMICKGPQGQTVQVPSKGQYASNQVGPLQERVHKVPSVAECPTSKLKPLQEEVPKVVKVLSIEQDITKQLKPLQEMLPKVPSKVGDPTNQMGPCCKINLEKVPKVVQVPSKEQDSTNQPIPLQEKVPKVPSKAQDATNQLGPCCKSNLENVPKVLKVPSAALCPTNQLIPLQEKVVKVLSKEQDPTNQVEPCCKSTLEKVPKVVQVPSQSRAVEESSQCPEEKNVPVHEETQYEPTPESPRSTQILGPCSCKTCKMPPPPPQLPVKAQSNNIASPERCLTIAPAQIDAPKKQKARRLNVSCQGDEDNESKVDTQCQHQSELSACCKDTTPSQNNCHEVNQVFHPITIRSQSYSTVAIKEETGDYSVVNEVSVVNKFTHSVTYASNDGAQTSDHSIHFEKDACCSQYPLFFKIIYADTSKNE